MRGRGGGGEGRDKGPTREMSRVARSRKFHTYPKNRKSQVNEVGFFPRLLDPLKKRSTVAKITSKDVGPKLNHTELRTLLNKKRTSTKQFLILRGAF